ncbi:MAG: hypothetical protein U0992_23475 [Planctomycetaceae bacterium]
MTPTRRCAVAAGIDARREEARKLAAAKDARLLEMLPAEQLAAWEAEYARTIGAWKTAVVETAKSGGGATLTPQEDGSLLAGGTRPDKDVYTVDFKTGASRVTGIRLEVLTHDSLPMRGPGRQDNGNLHLSELRAFVFNKQQQAVVREIVLQKPVADFNQEGWTIAHALDGNPNTAWGIHPAVGQDHQAVVEVKSPVELGAMSCCAWSCSRCMAEGI